MRKDLSLVGLALALLCGVVGTQQAQAQKPKAAKAIQAKRQGKKNQKTAPWRVTYKLSRKAKKAKQSIPREAELAKIAGQLAGITVVKSVKPIPAKYRLDIATSGGAYLSEAATRKALKKFGLVVTEFAPPKWATTLVYEVLAKGPK